MFKNVYLIVFNMMFNQNFGHLILLIVFLFLKISFLFLSENIIFETLPFIILKVIKESIVVSFW